MGPDSYQVGEKREQAIKTVGELCKKGLSIKQIAKKTGQNERTIACRLGRVKGVIAVPGDGKGAEELDKMFFPLDYALRILGNRHRYDWKRGVHLVDGHITPVGDIFDLAGIERPGAN